MNTKFNLAALATLLALSGPALAQDKYTVA